MRKCNYQFNIEGVSKERVPEERGQSDVQISDCPKLQGVIKYGFASLDGNSFTFSFMGIGFCRKHR